MYIRRIIHTDNDLAMRVSQRFMKRWHRLLRAYEKRHWKLSQAAAMKCVNVAWAVFSAVTEGNAALPANLENFFEHRTHEMIEVEGEPMYFDDSSIEEQLIWDSVCLMLEEVEPRPEWQYAYDIASPHAHMAYDAGVLGDEVEEATEIVAEAIAKPVFDVPTSTASREITAIASEKANMLKYIACQVELLQGKSLEERTRGSHLILRTMAANRLELPDELLAAVLALDDDIPTPFNQTINLYDHSQYIKQIDNQNMYK